MIEQRKELERSFLSSLLFSSYQLPNVLAMNVDDSLFIDTDLKTIFNFILDYKDENSHNLNTSSLYEYLLTRNASEKIKKEYYEIIKIGPGDPLHLVKVLIEDNKEIEFRKIINESLESGKTGLDLIIDTNEKLSRIVFDTYEKHKGDRDKVSVMHDLLEQIKNNKEGKTGDYIPTKITYLDKKIIGIYKKGLTIIAGRPGQGKTAFALQLARNFSAQNLRVGIFSAEMDMESLLIRDLADHTGIDSLKIESGDINELEYFSLKSAADDIIKRKIVYDDSAYQTPAKIKSKINLWTMKHKIDVVIIDYLTLIKTNYKKNRFDLEISEMTGDFNSFSKSNGIPIIILAQLNRDVEKRPDKKPQLSDLRESGSIEQDARTVLFLYRPSYYGLEMPIPKDKDGRCKQYFTDDERLFQSNDEYCEIIISKSRNGKVGTIPVRYQKELHRFSNLFVR